MALYTFTCLKCGDEEDVAVPYKMRDEIEVACLECQLPKKRMFPLEAARGIGVFTPYWDEALGVNIYTAEQKKRELKKRGLVEAGDKSGGASLFDDKLPSNSQIAARPLKDGRYDSAIVDKTAAYDDFAIESVGSNGETVDGGSFSELEADEIPDPVAAKAAFNNLTLNAAKSFNK